MIYVMPTTRIEHPFHFISKIRSNRTDETPLWQNSNWRVESRGFLTHADPLRKGGNGSGWRALIRDEISHVDGRVWSFGFSAVDRVAVSASPLVTTSVISVRDIARWTLRIGG